jgi:hypothetical protein
MTSSELEHHDTSSSPADIGVLTFHRCVNNGSWWQTRCLVDGLRARGHDVVVMDHRSARVDRAEWRCALQPTLPTQTVPGDRHSYRRKVDLFLAAIATLPCSTPFALDRPCDATWPRTVVVGSDEVWNPSHPWYGGASLFFGQGVRAERLVSYAASAGNHDASCGIDPQLVEHLRRFDAVSVRDENSRALVGRALAADPVLVLDPCLQFPPVLEGTWIGPDGPFAVVYGHNFSGAARTHVRQWADERGCRLLSVGYRNDWADEQWLDAGPHDFALAIARSSAVVTNFFHGCVFALLHDRPFACETSPYRHHKVQSLMHELGGEAHLVGAHDPGARWSAALDAPVSGALHDALAVRRAASERFLDLALDDR